MTDQYIQTAKQAKLSARMRRLGIHDEDLVEKFILGSGKGGQKRNKTSSCVYLRHIPTGIEVKCRRERSQSLNRFFARRELCDKIEEKVLGEKSRRRQEMEKVRRRKRRRSRRAKERLLADKHKHAEKKRNRTAISFSEPF